MFKTETYSERRKRLKKQVASGVVVFPGNDEAPMNYPGNAYPFRQDSSFLYFFGLDTPGLAGVIDVEADADVIYGDDITLEDVIWMGELPKLRERALEVGVTKTASLAQLAETLRGAAARRRRIHYLPPYRAEIRVKLAEWLGIPAGAVRKDASDDLIRAVVAQRSTKSDEEIAEVEKALDVTREMYLAAMKMARPGVYEREIVGAIDGLALARGFPTAFPTILTINGQVFHNLDHGHKLEKGRLLVIDAGVSTPKGYASDITRTLPTGGKFTPRQRDIYEVVLAGQSHALGMIRPEVMHKDIHLAAAWVMAQGLKELGLMKGEIDDAVEAGAHALFFPHGLGHMLGLDVHDMEGLGENFVGYDDTVERSDQFGLAYLRMARRLEPGFVLTCEPGIYFIPPLIDRWRKEARFGDFIDYEKVETYKDFTGIRIEDDVLVTASGNRVLGTPIPKTVKDVEKAMALKDKARP
jgi:Xaa-Pro aminopeptidase